MRICAVPRATGSDTSLPSYKEQRDVRRSVWMCVYVFSVNKLRTLLIQWEHSIEQMMATFNSTLFETWVWFRSVAGLPQ